MECDGQRRPAYVKEDDQGEHAIPYLHTLRVHIELVPWHFHLCLAVTVPVPVPIVPIRKIAIRVTVGIRRDRLIKHFQELTLFHVIPHIIEATSQEDEQADFAPKLSYPLLALNLVHLAPRFVNLDAASYRRLNLGLFKHLLDFFILGLLLLLRGQPPGHETRLIEKLSELLFGRAPLMNVVIVKGKLAYILLFCEVLVVLFEIDLLARQFDCIVAKKFVPVRIIYLVQHLGLFSLIEACLIQCAAILYWIGQISIAIIDIFASLLDQTINFKIATTVTHTTRFWERRRAATRMLIIVNVVGADQGIVVGDKSVKILDIFFGLCSWFFPASILLFRILTEATIIVL